MKRVETIQVERERVVEVTCNRCGRVCTREHVNLKHSWGYDSRKDLEAHESHLCEDCYDWLVAQFRIPVKISNYA